MALPTRPHRVRGLEIVGPYGAGYADILCKDALIFLRQLERGTREQRLEIARRRLQAREGYANGVQPQFSDATEIVRESAWKVESIPAALRAIRTEIVGGTTRSSILDLLNSGADVCVADFAEATAPTWSNLIEAQLHLHDVVRGTIEVYHSATRTIARPNRETASLALRPRCLTAEERHIVVDGEPCSGGLVDFALFFWHNVKAMVGADVHPRFDLVQLESHLEARWWGEIFAMAEDMFGLPAGTIKTSVSIDTVSSAFEMDEILHELRRHVVAIGCGDQRYVQSFVRCFANEPDLALPDCSLLVDSGLLRSQADLVLRTSKNRGVRAIGRLAREFTSGSPAKDSELLASVRERKANEAAAGFHATRVADPGVVAVAHEQLASLHTVGGDVIEDVAPGQRTENALRQDARLAILCTGAWLLGRGSVHDGGRWHTIASADLARARAWQWVRHGVVLEDGAKVDGALIERITNEELWGVLGERRVDALTGSRYRLAAKIFEKAVVAHAFPEDLAGELYSHLVSSADQPAPTSGINGSLQAASQ